MKPFAIVVGAVAATALIHAYRGSAQGPPGLALEAHAEAKAGSIRMYAETHYILRDNGRVVWEETVREKYGHHWISSDGNVWILTSAMPGPGGGGSMTVRDRKGRLLARWASWSIFAGRPPKDVSYDLDALKKIDLSKTRLITLRPGVAEQLRMSLIGGAESRVTLLSEPSGGKIAVQRWLEPYHAKKPDELEGALTDAKYGNPEPSSFHPKATGLSLWRAKSRVPDRPDRIWLQAETNNTEKMWVSHVVSQQRLKRMPTEVLQAPNYVFLWFEFAPASGKGGEAILRTLRNDGHFVKSFDLLKLGGFANAAQAEQSLKWRVSQVMVNGQGPTLDKADGSYGMSNTLGILDDRNRRWLLKVSPTGEGSLQILSGYAAREKKDVYGDKIESERFYDSPNHRFRARVRWYKPPRPERPGSLTLLALVPENGRTAEVELWSSIFYGGPAAVYVSNSGRTFSFWFDRNMTVSTDPKTGRTTDAMADHAVFRVQAPDGRQLAGMDMLEPEGYHSNAEAKQGILYKSLVIESKGQTEQVVDGLRLPKATSESFVLRHRSGKVRRYFVGTSPYAQGEVVFWKN